MNTPYVLASNSPRRKELLTLMGLDFVVYPSTAEEILDPSLTPSQAVMALARQKALDVSGMEGFSGRAIIAADTMVMLSGVLLGKPDSPRQAVEMLKALRGREHVVLTGICVVRGERSVERCEQTTVCFSHIPDEVIERYVATGDPLDKAGAYSVQGFLAQYIPRIEGCYYNVMGLPLNALRLALEEINAL